MKPPRTASGNRVLYVNKEMAKLLKAWKQQCAWERQQEQGEPLQKDDYLFRQPNGDPMVPSAAQNRAAGDTERFSATQ